MKLSDSKNKHIAAEGKIASQGFTWRLARLSLIMLPQEGVGGLTERPKKANAPPTAPTPEWPPSGSPPAEKRPQWARRWAEVPSSGFVDRSRPAPLRPPRNRGW